MITGATIQRNEEGFVTRGYNSNRYRAAARCQVICENPQQRGWVSQVGDKRVVIVPCAGQTQFRHLGPPSRMMGDLGWGMPPGEWLIPHPPAAGSTFLPAPNLAGVCSIQEDPDPTPPSPANSCWPRWGHDRARGVVSKASPLGVAVEKSQFPDKLRFRCFGGSSEEL